MEGDRTRGFIFAEISDFQPYSSYVPFQWNNIDSQKSIIAEMTSKHLSTVCTLAQKIDTIH